MVEQRLAAAHREEQTVVVVARKAEHIVTEVAPAHIHRIAVAHTVRVAAAVGLDRVRWVAVVVHTARAVAAVEPARIHRIAVAHTVLVVVAVEPVHSLTAQTELTALAPERLD
ncbi:MAG: hypothetical protein FWD67_12070 [Betaproteobacteria bacterium]|nr:hypothetical protein [Betaproteobacteria bacterium]